MVQSHQDMQVLLNSRPVYLTSSPFLPGSSTLHPPQRGARWAGMEVLCRVQYTFPREDFFDQYIYEIFFGYSVQRLADEGTRVHHVKPQRFSQIKQYHQKIMSVLSSKLELKS